MDEILSDQLLSLLPTLFPGMSEKTYQEVINNIADITGIIYNLNKVNELLLTYNKLELIPVEIKAVIGSVKEADDKNNRDIIQDKINQGWYYINELEKRFYQAYGGIDATFFGHLFTLGVIGGELGYSNNYILTLWVNFLKRMNDTYNDGNNQEAFFNIYREAFDFIYSQTMSLRAWLISVISGDIGNLAVVISDIETIKQRQDEDYNNLNIYIHNIGTMAHTRLKDIEDNKIPVIESRLKKLEESQTTIEENIQETVNNNTETIQSISDLLIEPISSFYNYKETNEELYLSELRIFAKIFQDVLDLGYISVQSDIENNLEKIIKGIK